MIIDRNDILDIVIEANKKQLPFTQELENISVALNKEFADSIGVFGKNFLAILTELIAKYGKNKVYKNIFTSRENALYKYSSARSLSFTQTAAILWLTKADLWNNDADKTSDEIENFLNYNVINNNLIYYMALYDTLNYRHGFRSIGLGAVPMIFKKYITISNNTYEGNLTKPRVSKFTYCLGIMGKAIIEPQSGNYSTEYISSWKNYNPMELLGLETVQHKMFINGIKHMWLKEAPRLTKLFKDQTDNLIKNYGQYLVFSSL